MSNSPTDSTSAQDLAAAPKPRARRFLALRIGVGLVLFVIVIVFVGRQLRQDFKEMQWDQVHIRPAIMALAMATFLLVRVLNGVNIKLLLAAMGVSVPARKVLPIIWVASIGRYIPGKVAVAGGSLLMLMAAGVPLALAMPALFLAIAMTMLTGLLAATPLLFTPVMREHWPSGPLVAMASLVAGIVCLYPVIFLRLCNVVMRLLKRPPLPGRMRLLPFGSAIALTLVRIFLLGLCLWLAGRSFLALPLSQLPYTLGVAGLATTIGFLAVFAPAGLGVHEAVFMITMTPVIGQAQAGLLAILMRLLNLIADSIMAAVGALLRQGSRPVENVPAQLAGAK